MDPAAVFTPRQLCSVPLRNRAVDESRQADGTLRLTLRGKRGWKWLLLRLIFVVPRARHVVLDEIGEMVWRRCDGTHTVEEVLASLILAYPDEKDMAYRLREFFRMMMERKLIAMAVGGDDAPPAGGKQ